MESEIVMCVGECVERSGIDDEIAFLVYGILMTTLDDCLEGLQPRVVFSEIELHESFGDEE